MTVTGPRLHLRLLFRLLGVVSILLGAIIPTASTFAQTTAPFVPATPTISGYLSQQLATAQEPIPFLIILRDQVDAAQFVATATVHAASRVDRASMIYHELTTQALASQAALRAWLAEQGISYRAYYLVNMIEVEGDQALATALAKRPEVARLVANPQVENTLTETTATTRWAQQLVTLGADEVAATAALPYGLEYTHADAVWAAGYTGQGIVIASQDTGVQWDHPALQAAYRGWVTQTVTTTLTATGNVTTTVNHVYNWFDAWGLDGRPITCAQDAQIPCDDHGHGTHTVGTMVGDATAQGASILGMAPGAQWIGCRNMRRGVGTPASYTACFEFFLAPYPQGGDPFTDGRPELAPHIINNSWGCPVSEGCDATSLRQVVETMRAAGQMVVASAGNDGIFGCSSVQAPIAMHDAVFSVGAHDSTGTIAGFSSRGPVTADGSGRLKPDISAPGVNVISANLGGGTVPLSGTSMASPHVAGAVALLWSAVPALIGDIDRTEQILIKSATPVPANNCGEGGTPVVPNNTFGFGRLNIQAAIAMAQAPVGLTVAVTESNGQPVSDWEVTVIDTLTGYRYTAVTVFNGVALFPDLYAGAYQVETALSTPAQNVVLSAGQPNHLSLQLAAPPPTIDLYFPQVLN